MQKTYDECYLSCSTAIYFESQNNEVEALRSWRNALDQIYYHNAFRVPANYRAKNETEKALQDSLQQLELQCKERVDLLEALKRSREDAEEASKSRLKDAAGSEETAISSGISGLHITGEGSKPENWLGSGTIRPMDYADISRPSLPRRPAPSLRATSNPDGIQSQRLPERVGRTDSYQFTPLQPAIPTGTSRTPSPQKKSRMLRTLRTNNREGKASKFMDSSRSRPPAAATAATQAWGTLAGANSKGSKPHISDGSPRSSRDFDKRQSFDSSKSPSDFPRKWAYSRTTSTSSFAHNQSDEIEKSSNEPPRALERRSKPLSDRDADCTQEIPRELSGTAKAKRNSTYSQHGQSKGWSSEQYAGRAEHGVRPSRTDDHNHQHSAQGYDPHTRGLVKPSSPVATGSYHTSNKEQRVVNRKARSNAPPVDSRKANQIDIPTFTTIDRPDQDTTETHLLMDETISGEDDREVMYQSERVRYLFEHPLPGIEAEASRQILNEIVVRGDEVHWTDVAGLDIAKDALKETVVYPFLRPDLFMGLREPARGMLLFGPPGTGKTMLARAVATESKSTFFAISASSLTSKFLGESEKLVKALFALAKALAPSIIFVDEIDSLLSSRADTGEHEATRRIKTEFLIQWSDLARAAAGKEQSSNGKVKGDASRVLVLAATNLPWAIDEAARRRFVRRQYIPLPEAHVRKQQFETLLSHQKHTLEEADLQELVGLTDGFSGSDVTALAKDAAMGPLRSLGEKLLHMNMEDIRPIELNDFKRSLNTIRPSVSKEGLQRFEDWAKEFGERGG